MSEANKPPQKYGSNEPVDNRYRRAKEAWDSRIGDARVQAANWRKIAFLTIVLCVLLTMGLIYQGSQVKIRPFIVKVDSEGSATNLGPVNQNYNPKQPEIRYFLRQIVEKTQSVPLDPVIARNNWLTIYSFLRPAAANKMNSIFQKDNPISLVGKETHEVKVNVVVPISDNTYQVRWTKTIYDKDGLRINSYDMTGIFTIDLVPPKDEQTLNINPLGLYVKDFNWEKETLK